MGIQRNHRFDVDFGEAFPLGLVLVGELAPDNEYQENRSRPARQKVDERTGKRQWIGTFTDPAPEKAKQASIQVRFLADVQPVPTTPEMVPGLGMRQADLTGLQVTPKVTGNGEFKTLGWDFYATGFAGSGSLSVGKTNGPAAGKPGNAGGATGSEKSAA